LKYLFCNGQIKSICVSLCLLILAAPSLLNAQDTTGFFEPAPAYNSNRGLLVATGLSVTYTASMTGLYALWYKDYPSTSFHFFDDNEEWFQMDKAGHIGSAYYLGNWGISLFRWTGMEEKKAIWLGGSSGLVFLTTIEIFDAYSAQWGFSNGDMIANIAGTGLVIAQELAWKDQRIKIKFSYHDTKYPNYRPALLGESFTENLFKDYNGQTYWISANIKSFLKKESRFPAWLNIAAGYGAEGMTGARTNLTDDTHNTFVRYRQIYLAPDIDLTKIPVKSKFLKTIFGAFGFLKFPAPTIEFNKIDDVKFHLIYF